MPITLNGDTGITFPAGGTGNPAGTVVGTSDTQTMTNKTIGSGYAGSTIVLGTAQNSTSGTFIDFTGIPSWVKRITVMFNGVSTNGTSLTMVQIGSGSFVTSGYLSTTLVGTTSTAVSTGFAHAGSAATDTRSGIMMLNNVSGNTWVSSGTTKTTTGNVYVYGGDLTLGGVLDRVRITTVNGTDTFDAGSINIMYE